MADDDCIVLSDSDDGPPAPAAKRARGGAPAGADGDVELVDAQPAPLLADDRGESSDDDDEVRVVGTTGEARHGALLRLRTQRSARASSRAARRLRRFRVASSGCASR